MPQRIHEGGHIAAVCIVSRVGDDPLWGAVLIGKEIPLLFCRRFAVFSLLLDEKRAACIGMCRQIFCVSRGACEQGYAAVGVCYQLEKGPIAADHIRSLCNDAVAALLFSHTQVVSL